MCEMAGALHGARWSPRPFESACLAWPYRRPRAGLPTVLRAGGIFDGEDAMDEMKPKQPWTPGEWRSDYDEVDAFADVYAVGQGDNGCSLHIVDVRGVNAKADGKLMAAAPAMAEALAMVVRRYDSRTTDDMVRGPGERKDPPDVAAARAALDLCGWRWS